MINPNSSVEVTDRIRDCAKKYNKPNLTIEVISLDNAPLGIETYEDELIASVEVIKYLKEHINGYDGVIIACYSDPGLYAANEMFDVPVVGIASAALHIASLKGQSIGFVTTGGSEDIDIFHEIAGRYGLKDKVNHIECMGVGVNGLSLDMKQLVSDKVNICKSLGVQSVILGCGAFAGFGDDEAMDGIKESIAVLEMMIGYNTMGCEDD